MPIEEATLIIRVKVPVNPALVDPYVIAEYLLDSNADDPVYEFLHAEWLDRSKW